MKYGPTILEIDLTWTPGFTYDGENFYISTNNEIYKVTVDFDTQESSYETYFSLDDETKLIYSIEYRDGFMYYDTTELDSDGNVDINTKTSNVISDLLSISSDETDVTVSQNSTYELSLIKYPTGSTGDIAWTSSDESVVTVDGNGKITGVSVGTATVTASYEDMQVVYNITVTEEVISEEKELTTYETEIVDTYEIIIFDTKVTLESILTSDNFPVLEDSSYSIKVFDEDGNEKTDTSEYIGSKNTIIIYQNGTTKATYTAVVPGDVTGDGILRMYDAFQILKDVIASKTMDSLDCIIRDHSSSGDRIVRMYDAFQYLKDAIKG